MTDDHPALPYCKRDLQIYGRLLADYKAGHRRIGHSTDGFSWTDTTAEHTALLEKKIEELRALLVIGR